MPKQRLFFAIPAMNEMASLPLTLQCISQQQCEAEIHTYICVNQPEKWWEEPNRIHICQENQRLLDYLQNCSMPNLFVLDKSSRGNGWTNAKPNVGWARKLLVEQILETATDDDLLFSMDADTTFNPAYCQSIVDNFAAHKRAVGMAVPYYHLLIGKEQKNRAMLHYEIYMRHFNLNLLRINSPYAYTALGSAIVCPIKSYRTVGGFDKKQSGEDFYCLRKLRKYGKILLYNEEKVFPATRFSTRTPFGTGQAIMKGCNGLWDAYPIFHYTGFDVIGKAYQQIPVLFWEDVENEFITTLQTVFSKKDLWPPLREYCKSETSFTRAFHNKADGLRIFQFLRIYQLQINKTDEECLSDFLQTFYPKTHAYFFQNQSFSFEDTPIEKLNQLRDFFVEQETLYQKLYDSIFHIYDFKMKDSAKNPLRHAELVSAPLACMFYL